MPTFAREHRSMGSAIAMWMVHGPGCNLGRLCNKWRGIFLQNEEYFRNI